MDLLASAAGIRSAQDGAKVLATLIRQKHQPLPVVPPPEEPAAKKLNKHDQKWLAKFKELQEFYRRTGHTRVPRDYEVVNGSRLGLWVKNQRLYYKQMVEGTSGRMTADRVRLLDSLGFEWVVINSDLNWQDWYQLLCQFQKQYGHVRVPCRYETIDGYKLGSWTTTQRALYKKSKEGRDSTMTPDRVIPLERLGFEWTIKEDGEEQQQPKQQQKKPKRRSTNRKSSVKKAKSSVKKPRVIKKRKQLEPLTEEETASDSSTSIVPDSCHSTGFALPSTQEQLRLMMASLRGGEPPAQSPGHSMGRRSGTARRVSNVEEQALAPRAFV